jgi:hypothetical protein
VLQTCLLSKCCPQTNCLSLHFCKNITCLSAWLLSIGQIFSLSCQIVCQWIMKNCRFMSNRVILPLKTLSLQIPILNHPIHPAASHVHIAVHISFPCLLQTPLHVSLTIMYYLDINKESHHYHATFLHPDSLDLSCVPASPEARMYWLLCIFTALSAVRSYTARRIILEKNTIGTNITNFTTIWIPKSYVYNVELTLFLAVRILFNLYILSLTYFNFISKGMNISLHCITLTLSDTHTHWTWRYRHHVSPQCWSHCFIMQNTTSRIAAGHCWSVSLHYKSSDSKAPCFLNFSTSWQWVKNFILQEDRPS